MRFYVRFKEKCYTAVVEKHAHELRSALNKSEIYIQRVAMLFRQAFFFVGSNVFCGRYVSENWY